MIVTIMHNGRQSMYDVHSVEFRSKPLELRLYFPDTGELERLILHQFDSAMIGDPPAKGAFGQVKLPPEPPKKEGGIV